MSEQGHDPHVRTNVRTRIHSNMLPMGGFEPLHSDLYFNGIRTHPDAVAHTIIDIIKNWSLDGIDDQTIRLQSSCTAYT
jgi:hypothetical protein